MQVLVTGGAGFIGGHLAERFLREGHDVVVLDEMHPYYDLGLKRHTIDLCDDLVNEIGSNYEFIEGDARDTDLVNELVESADYVYHQAARTGVRDSLSEPRVYNAVNVHGRGCHRIDLTP